MKVGDLVTVLSSQIRPQRRKVSSSGTEKMKYRHLQLAKMYFNIYLLNKKTEHISQKSIF